jgi:hypothetical protein
MGAQNAGNVTFVGSQALEGFGVQVPAGLSTDLAVAFACCDAAAPSWTPGAGWTQLQQISAAGPISITAFVGAGNLLFNNAGTGLSFPTRCSIAVFRGASAVLATRGTYSSASLAGRLFSPNTLTLPSGFGALVTSHYSFDASPTVAGMSGGGGSGWINAGSAGTPGALEHQTHYQLAVPNGAAGPVTVSGGTGTTGHVGFLLAVHP